MAETQITTLLSMGYTMEYITRAIEHHTKSKHGTNWNLLHLIEIIDHLQQKDEQTPNTNSKHKYPDRKSSTPSTNNNNHNTPQQPLSSKFNDKTSSRPSYSKSSSRVNMNKPPQSKATSQRNVAIHQSIQPKSEYIIEEKVNRPHKKPIFESFKGAQKKEIIHRIDGKPKIAVAIDFGTYGLKISYSVNGKILTQNSWKSKKYGNNISQRTAILIDGDGKLKQFGQDAIDMYLKRPDWTLFRELVSELYGMYIIFLNNAKCKQPIFCFVLCFQRISEFITKTFKKIRKSISKI